MNEELDKTTSNINIESEPQTPVSPKSYFIPSIIATVLCCPPTGALGIINAARVERFFQQKRYLEAELASKTALKWIKISIFTWVVCVALYMIIAVLFYEQGIPT